MTEGIQEENRAQGRQLPLFEPATSMVSEYVRSLEASDVLSSGHSSYLESLLSRPPTFVSSLRIHFAVRELNSGNAADRLGVSKSLLSQILKNQRRVLPALLDNIATNFDLTDVEKEEMAKLAEEHNRTISYRKSTN